ncbi:hypothetical protein O181_074408 [Austropuccinia psidii MF-1]|uniref:Uncharacterized protein n=1 Tax=Austropuccinia psidii MF-1 TaxID=1389203 RepID=A0A9Q3F6V4_9BASI|nr:hypothetical protein [Austropuccinia psidii MF-1]
MEQNHPNPPQQDSPLPSLLCKQSLWQSTPGPSGTQWSEELSCSKQPKFHLISTFDSIELTLPPFVESSQTNEPPILCPSPSSKTHEDFLTCEPETEVASTQSMGEPFGKSQLHFFYSSKLFFTFPPTICNLSHSTPLRHHHRQYADLIPPFSPSTHVPPPSPVPLRTPPPPSHQFSYSKSKIYSCQS